MSKDINEKAEELGGKAKEAFGEATNDESVKDEGKADQVKSDVKEKFSDAGDAVKDGINKIAGKFQDK
ncbi:CsbD family protein [Corynebacterium yudongzhengii]|uniref:CsbD family protein n=1 Tax=Corynebacterium yudongzhengii TaxID=2080740 RepID=A0A2U1T5Q5_9CORY|nr:CsbD family protein [Corynebacterium yudongzhengii]AWB82897.1 CsbD family protein [Corynebacterium yudongzhengii]PWC01305.1 CsbD family protein [Corynebacterium yudongzhengii]